MYLRFTVGECDPESHNWKGIFTAAIDFKHRSREGSIDRRSVQEILDWFNVNLPVPDCYGEKKDPRAVCWFRPTAGEPLTRMWKLVAFLHSNGSLVQLHKTKDPGKRVYSDDYQIVAVPQARERRWVHTFRLR